MRIKPWQRRFYDFFINHWALSTFFMTAPAFWFTFVKLFGKNLGLITEEGLLSSWSLTILYSLLVSSFIFTLFKNLADKHNEMVKYNAQYVLNIMLQGVNKIKSRKVHRFTTYIQRHHQEKDICPFYEITKPRAQIAAILEVFQETLSRIFNIDEDLISLGLLFKTDQENTWRWLHTHNLSNGMSLEDLIGNSQTSARQIIDGKINFLFYPDKRVAILEQKYVPGKNDDVYSNIGSILCKDISLGVDEKHIQAILVVSSHGYQICAQGDVDATYKIRAILLPAIEKRIQLELALLYIKEVIGVSPSHEKVLPLQ